MPPSDEKRLPPPKSREDRLAEALRVNLKRRKAAERAKGAAAVTQPPAPNPEVKA